MHPKHPSPPKPFSSNTLSLNKNREEKYTKREKQPFPRKMFRFLSTLITVGTLGYGAWWINDTQPHLKDRVLGQIHFGSIDTFEPRFTSKQIITKERLSLPKEEDPSTLAPMLEFHPYLLMRVKFVNQARETEEGVILWDLNEGEMVLNTKHWETTHFFADCINARASAHEYTIINAIASNNGRADRQTLTKALNLDPSLTAMWIERCRQKKLIVKHEDGYRIHLQSPIFHLTPSTEIISPLITKNRKSSKRLPRRYSPTQVKKAAELAFGSDFAIRSAQDVFLPVYSIKTENSDGSLRTSFWNALNGQRIHHHSSLIE